MSEREKDETERLSAIEYEIDTGTATNVEPDEPEEEEQSQDEPEEEDRADEEAESKTESESEQKPDDDDDEGLSDKVRQRIAKMTWRLRETERVARGLAEENRRLAEKHKEVSEVAITSTEKSIEARKRDAEARYKTAVEAGNTEEMLKATDDLMAVKVEESQLAAMKARQQKAKQVHTPPPEQTAPQQPDREAVEWAERNPWFGKDEVMTASAYAIDYQLKREGIDPRSEEYYSELDRRLRKRFPAELSGDKSHRPAPRATVAPGSRTSPGQSQNSRRSVRLSPSQVEIANKLGISPALYAKYLNQK